ncbi:MAG TPA: TlyA family RNA methyltransferase [Chloroflexia bacterium]|nr:TlyA family RNA methyltransferase [Chloroflexia bacterium]
MAAKKKTSPKANPANAFQAPRTKAQNSKLRVDQWLVERGLAETREKAKALIMAGQVLAGTRRVDKPGENMDEATATTLTLKAGATLKYVSRGGLKLEKALDFFGVNPAGLLVLDIGASTGGFTDCVLQRGARAVIDVDVGHNQLAWSLRNDPRVIVLDKTNIRYLEELPVVAGEGETPALAELVVIDVSFISLKLVLPAARRLSKPHVHILALVKPQFEAGREQVGKGGIIRDPAVHRGVLLDLVKWCEQNSFEIQGLTTSPILGTEGNREFLAHLVAHPENEAYTPAINQAELLALVDQLVEAEVEDTGKQETE